MSASSITLARVALPLPTTHLPKAIQDIKKLPLDIVANIASFLPTTTRLSTMRQVCKEWNTLPFDGGHLDLSKMKKLSDLDLRNILDGIEKRGGKITSLNLTVCNSITGAGLAHLAHLPLTSLNLYGCNKITDASLAHLAKLPLTFLSLAWCHITSAGLAHLAKLRLTSLSLAGVDINDAGFAHLAELPLTSLNLARCDIADAGLAHLTKHPLLTSLVLSGCDIADGDLTHLGELPHLTSLDLSGCDIADGDLTHLAKLPLTSLSLAGCNINDAGLAHCAELHLLTSLDLTVCNSITDAGVAHLAKLPLISLNLDGCNITDAGLAHLAKLPLTSLNLEWCSDITDAGLAHLVELLNLSSLNLLGCKTITDAGLPHLSKLSFLTSLNLDECNITHAGLAHLAELSLTSLSLVGCNKITDAGARAFKAGLISPALTDVGLRKIIDHYIYVLASQPKGGDRWRVMRRYEDHNRLRLAQAIAVQTLNSESFKDSWLEKSLSVIEIINLTGSSVLNKKQRAKIDAVLEKIPSNIRSDVDDQVSALAPEPKGADNWGQLHRYDDLSRLRRAVIKALENSLFTTFPIKPKTGLRILGKR